MKPFVTILFLLIIPLHFVYAIPSYISNEIIFNYISYENNDGDTTGVIKKNNSNFKNKLDNINQKMETIIKYSPIPVVSYSSITDWLFGITKINSFRIGAKDQSDTTIQPSTITALAYLTLNNQYKFVLSSKLMFGENKYISATKFMMIDFPEIYFGIGNNTKSSDSCLVTTKNIAFNQSFAYKPIKRWYIGIKYSFNNYIKVDTIGNDVSCNIDVSNLPENEGIQSGIGIMISRETRDNRFNARKGSYLLFKYMNFGNWIGSKFNYNSFTFEYNKYITPIKGLTIASQVYTEAKFGDVPIQSLARMGGSHQMRGIYNGRFRDHTMITTQVELRFPIFWIFGGAVFTGFGEVAPDYEAYTWDGIKWTYGAGLRMMVYKATRTNLRFDVGFFEKRPLFFFTFSEAF